MEYNVDNKYSSWENHTVVKASGTGTYSSDSGKLTGSYLVTYYEMEDYQGKQSEKNLSVFGKNTRKRNAYTDYLALIYPRLPQKLFI